MENMLIKTIKKYLMPTIKIHDFVMPILGTDPEIFIRRNGKIIGSEKIMPKDGIIYRHGVTYLDAGPHENNVVKDGVQVELHPTQSKCREILANNIRQCLVLLSYNMKKFPDTEIDFSPLVEVSRDEMDSLSSDSKQLGCMPSFNIYGEPRQQRNGEEYLFRSAGGHIHLGDDSTKKLNDLLTNDKELVPLLDVIVGNTCVLIDRDAGNVERRKVYGRAGEYRLPKYGIEYRVLSNFWLRSYPMMSLVMGLARFAVNVLNSGKKNTKAIMSKVNIEDIRKAINENDFELAYKNFSKIKKVITEMVDEEKSFSQYNFPLKSSNLKSFEHFIKMGMDNYFPEKDILGGWINNGNSGNGWENFLNNVDNQMKSAK